MSEFKYLRTVLDKHDEMNGEIRERIVKKCVMESFPGILKGRNASMDVKTRLVFSCQN